MGSRRVRNLQALGLSEVVGFEPRADRRSSARDAYGIKVYDDLAAAFGCDPAAVVISAPPRAHAELAAETVARRLPFFSELNLLPGGLPEIVRAAAAHGVLAASSCTLRFHPSILRMKRLVEGGSLGRVLAFTYHSGQYLPDWHPWEDYRSFFAARRETGACREILAFELAWLTWMFGSVESAKGFGAKVSDLDAEIEDVYQVLYRFTSGALGHLLVDAVARVPVRHLRVLCADGVIEWRASDKALRVFDAVAGAWTTHDEPAQEVREGYVAPEDMYVEEMRAFLQATRGEASYPYQLAEELANLELLEAAELDSEQRSGTRPGGDSNG